MKKSLKTLLFLFVALFTIGTNNVYASLNAGKSSSIQAGDKLIYSGKEGAKLEKADGVTYDAATQKLILENVNLDNLHLDCMKVTIELRGENTIKNFIWINSSNVNIIGNGSLSVNGVGPGTIVRMPSIYMQTAEISSGGDFAPVISFNMTGTVTALNGIGGYGDEYLATKEGITNYSPIVVGKNVKIVEGGEIKNDDSLTFIGNKDTTPKTYSTLKVVIKGEKTTTSSSTKPSNETDKKGTSTTTSKNDTNTNKNESTTVKNEKYTIMNGTTSFTSKEALDSDYSLNVEDKTSSLDNEKTTLLENEIKDSHLVLLYNISVVNNSGKVVTMKNGEYTIRLKISEADLKAYDKFTAIYIDEEGKVKEKFDTKIDGEYVEFTTSHLSDYGILGLKNVDSKESTSSNENNGKNNNSKIIIVSVVAGISLVIVCVAGIILRKKTIKK